MSNKVNLIMLLQHTALMQNLHTLEHLQCSEVLSYSRYKLL